MGLPQLDFRVPEATWFKSAFAGRFRSLPGLPGLSGLSGTGALAWPYKIAVVAVMALVACGTLVTFGSAEAETPSSSQVAALPGSDEASPQVEGQVLPPAQALLNSEDLLSSLNLTDFSPGEGATLSLTDDDDDNSDDSDDKTTSEIKKKLASSNTPTSKPTTGTKKPTTSPTTSAPKPEPTKTTAPAPQPEPTKTTAPEPEPEPEPTKDPRCSNALFKALNPNKC